MENADNMYIVAAGDRRGVSVSDEREYGGLRGPGQTATRASGLGVPGSVDGPLHNDGCSFISGAGFREFPALYPHLAWNLWRPVSGQLLLACYFL